MDDYELEDFMESFMDDDIDNLCDIIEEGANFDAFKEYRTHIKEIRDEIKITKKLLRAKKYDEVDEHCRTVLKMSDKLKKELIEIRDNVEGKPQKVLSAIIGQTLALIRDIFLIFLSMKIVPESSKYVSFGLQVKKASTTVNAIFQSISSDKKINITTFNQFINELIDDIDLSVSCIVRIQQSIKKRNQNECEDASVKKESVYYNNMEDEINMNCMNDFELENFMESSMDDVIDDIIEEGTKESKLEVRSLYKETIKEIKSEIKQTKTAIKNKEYKRAKKYCSEIITQCEVLKSSLCEIRDNNSYKTLPTMIRSTMIMIRDILTSLIRIIPNHHKNTDNEFSLIALLQACVDDFKISKLKEYINTLIKSVDLTIVSVKNIEKHVSKLEAEEASVKKRKCIL